MVLQSRRSLYQIWAGSTIFAPSSATYTSLDPSSIERFRPPS